VKDLRTAIQAIRAAASVMAEGRQYLELRGDLTGEFAAPKVQGPPQKIQVIALPKLPSGQSPEHVRITGVNTEHQSQPRQWVAIVALPFYEGAAARRQLDHPLNPTPHNPLSPRERLIRGEAVEFVALAARS
jgi:hypothetical protein